jgi:hypothetical protein
MILPILRCATAEEYAHWARLVVIPKAITNPSESFCRDALSGDVGWCLAERQAGRCCRDAATFRRLTRQAKGMDAEEAEQLLTPTPTPLTAEPITVVLPNEPIFPESPFCATFRYPVTETVHAVVVWRETTVCGIPLMGFRMPVPGWSRDFTAAGRFEDVTCRQCRRFVERDEAA